MSNLVKRILTTVIGVPAIAALIFLLPYYNHLAFCVLIFVCSILGSLEMGKLLFNKKKLYYALPAILPVVEYFSCLYSIKLPLTEMIFVLMGLAFISIETFTGSKDDFESSLIKASKRLLLILYPGYLITFAVKILSFNLGRNGGYYFAYMLLLVFSTDIFAYVFGMLFGRNSKFRLKVSPKKSLVGFIGGFVSANIVAIVLGRLWFDNVSVLFFVALGALVSLCAIFGDLTESMFKRSAKIKDSSNLIPGRGGMLDCLDSIVFTLPIFTLFLEILSL